MTYGGAVPAITPVYSGLVAGDTAASLTTPPHVLDHGHQLVPAGHLPGHLFGGGGRRHQLRRGHGDDRPGPA
jgi:hypothetical protein